MHPYRMIRKVLISRNFVFYYGSTKMQPQLRNRQFVGHKVNLIYANLSMIAKKWKSRV